MDAGNLKSNEKQKVTVENAAPPSGGAGATGSTATQTIVIEPANPEVIYVPSYQPTTIVYAPPPGIPPPYYYYSPPYPYYYSPAATFFTGAVFGAAIGYAFSWDDHDIYHGDVNIDRNVNINRTDIQNRVANRQANAGSRIERNSENAWRPSSSAVQRTQANAGTGAGSAARPQPQQIRSGLASREGAGGAGSPSERRAAPGEGVGSGRAAPSAYGSGGDLERARGDAPGQSGSRAAARGSEPARAGAFSGVDQGAAANRFSERGAHSAFGGGGAPRASFGGRAGGGGRGGFRR
jgi:hypothetical protein